MNTEAELTHSITLRDAAEALGVHYMTAYRYVRLGQLPAEKVAGQWRIDPADLAALVASPAPEEPLSLETATADLLDALVSGDEVAAWRIVSNVDLDPARVHTELLGPAMARVGQCWSRGELSIADEHQATSVASRVIGRLGPSFSRAGRKRGRVILGAPENDHHSLPCALFADLLRSEGLEVTDLGAATSARAFVEVTRRHEGRVVVVITATAALSDDVITTTVKELRNEWPDLPIAIGGHAIDSAEQADALGSAVWSASSRDAATRIAELAADR